ncbi:hypothetical protein S83_043385 [Arachis hypogaea]
MTHRLRSSFSPSLTIHNAHHQHLVRSASPLTIVVCALTRESLSVKWMKN